MNLETRSLIECPRGLVLGGKVLRLRHRLIESGLFTDEKLLELFDEHDPEELLVYRMGEDHRRLDDFRYGLRGRLTAQQLLDAVRGGQVWLNIINLTHNHDCYDELVDRIYDDLEAEVAGFETIERSANLLVSSPNAQVYYHADAPLNMLWHMRGSKRVWVYPGEERFAPREWVEKIFTRESDDDLPYDPDYDRFATPHDLEPGDMLTWPQNVPHRVENLSGLNVSLTTEHYTPQAMRKRTTYLANHYLQRWLGWPMANVEINGPGPALKRAAFHVARRVPGFHEVVEVDDKPKFSLI